MDKPPRAIASFADERRRMNPERKRGLAMIGIAVPVGALYAVCLALARNHDIVTNPKAYRLLGIPFAAAVIAVLVGLIKVVAGRTVRELGDAWDELTGWQRGIVGAVVVIAALAVIISLVAFALAILVDE